MPEWGVIEQGTDQIKMFDQKAGQLVGGLTDSYWARLAHK